MAGGAKSCDKKSKPLKQAEETAGPYGVGGIGVAPPKDNSESTSGKLKSSYKEALGRLG